MALAITVAPVCLAIGLFMLTDMRASAMELLALVASKVNDQGFVVGVANRTVVRPPFFVHTSDRASIWHSHCGMVELPMLATSSSCEASSL